MITIPYKNILKFSLALLAFSAVFFLATKPIIQPAEAAVCILKNNEPVPVKDVSECIKLSGSSINFVQSPAEGNNLPTAPSSQTENSPTPIRGNENTVDQTVDQCDPIIDPTCKLPGQESLFPPGSEGEQLFKDTQNAEQAKQTQSSVVAAANKDIPPYSCGANITCHIVRFLDWAISGLLRKPLVLVSGFLDQAVILALNLPLDKIGFVVQGWTIIRDVSNMFYVLILLWVALGTIFDFPKYNIREILPKLVISALLINFSLPLGMLVINTTNGLANVFYKGIVNAGTGINGEGQGRLLADKILENTDFVAIVADSVEADVQAAQDSIKKVTDQALKDLQETPLTNAFGNPIIVGSTGKQATKDCSSFAGLAKRGAENSTLGIDIEGSIAAVFSSRACRDAVLAYGKKVEAAQSYDLLAFARLSAIIWKIILIPTLIFILFAAALFIFIRTISLAFLLIFGPFVFLAMALPETRQYWTTWWDKLLKWSFFFPALMFMLFLSITLMTTFTGEKSFTTTDATQQVLTETAGKTGIATPNFFTANMHFLFMLMLLIGSLTVADKMGIEMAGHVRSLGRRAYSGIKRTAKRPVAAGGRIAKLNLQAMLGRGAGAVTSSEQFQRIANMPVFAKTGISGYAARVAEGRRRAGEAAAATRLKEKYGGDVTRMKPEEQTSLFATGAPGEVAGFYKKLDNEGRQKLWAKVTNTQRKAIEERLVKGGIPDDRALAMEQKDAVKVAKRINPGLANLEASNPQEFIKQTINTLQSSGFNFKNASPDFINSNMGLQLLKSIKKSEIEQVGSTKEGFLALHNIVRTLPNLGARIGASPDLERWLAAGPGRALLAGLYQPKEEGWQRLGKRFQSLESKIEKGGGGPSAPPPGRVPGGGLT